MGHGLWEKVSQVLSVLSLLSGEGRKEIGQMRYEPETTSDCFQNCVRQKCEDHLG